MSLDFPPFVQTEIIKIEAQKCKKNGINCSFLDAII